jgi:type IV pilus assembly protein PilA
MIRVSRGSKGFTLIELLIVVAIIGILAAIAIPAYSGYTAKAKMAGVVHSIGAIKNAVLAYYTESGGVPVAADAATIGSTFGVEVSTQYATYDVAANTGVIKATIAGISSDTNTKTLTLTPDFATKIWTWGTTNAMPSVYIPKS